MTLTDILLIVIALELWLIGGQIVDAINKGRSEVTDSVKKVANDVRLHH